MGNIFSKIIRAPGKRVRHTLLGFKYYT